ncbi:MAG: replication-associated recombination protein A [Desulfobulbus sp.]|jgi:putative ATPase|uniref:replication-associated recombination protein A n=1 Tax=Desulfobulbus sp. TaxID=895 RepID=UPI00283ACB03|nr:replication-associated recombination protein A [Desulfobulbus sp.]MDR2548886.1 replication-associated recombination protein A [Desulfobulbus sp.]
MIARTPRPSPLAERMRPRRLDDFVGQQHLVGEGKFLRQLIEGGTIPSLVFWGPPGSGKTTLATILAHAVSARFVFFSAVLSGVKEIRQIVEQAKIQCDQGSQPTILFVDEIHRFNKSQQDAFLPHVESGLLTLIGATTENPSFEITAPLLSRCQVLLLAPLQPDDIAQVIRRALADKADGLGEHCLRIEEEALGLLAEAADGDCRRALNYLETAANLTLDARPDSADGQAPTITAACVGETLQQKTLRYDASGEEHYNLISALHKSLRDSDPDGAMYWLARMLAGGEDPMYLARRMIRFASEDIGNADPQALRVALDCRDAYHMLGSPEGDLALIQAAAYLATAPKSNALYAGFAKVRADIQRTGSLPVPLHLRNAPTALMKDFGYGRGYQYAHDDRDALVLQEHLPPELAGTVYYEPTNRGYEAVIKDRLTKWKQILKQRAQHHAHKKNTD